jgi:hypothetical protein
MDIKIVNPKGENVVTNNQNSMNLFSLKMVKIGLKHTHTYTHTHPNCPPNTTFIIFHFIN